LVKSIFIAEPFAMSPFLPLRHLLMTVGRAADGALNIPMPPQAFMARPTAQDYGQGMPVQPSIFGRMCWQLPIQRRMLSKGRNLLRDFIVRNRLFSDTVPITGLLLLGVLVAALPFLGSAGLQSPKQNEPAAVETQGGGKAALPILEMHGKPPEGFVGRVRDWLGW
jgi:hypothetical protein